MIAGQPKSLLAVSFSNRRSEVKVFSSFFLGCDEARSSSAVDL